jgi:hypothetical protein
VVRAKIRPRALLTSDAPIVRSFAHIHQPGPVKYGQLHGSIGVREAIDKPMPIGQAQCVTWDAKGLEIWTIRIGQQQIPGRWVIVNQEFQQAH